MTKPFLPAERRRELLHQAHDLAGEMAGGSVTRTEISLVANVLFYVPGSWPERLAEAQLLLEEVTTSGLMKRGGRTATKLRNLQRFLTPILAKDLPAEELRFFLGWLMRFLRIRGGTGRH